ncbi:protein of unknown function [uncultured Sphingopyxis sp.]|uniref:Uncharacterized protein n=1 Tax=uncultured Sphingopyxis sp. TaxID=310581 RepID=A0A1Y5PV75_9SPHN|nr:protein of unknown function [uncultured Sphingopyxis sp.]
MLMPRLKLGQLLPACVEIETCLFASCVAREKQLIVGLARHKHGAGGGGRHGPSLLLGDGTHRGWLKLAHDRGEQVGCDVEMFDRVEIASELACRQPEENGGRQIPINRDMGLLRLGLGALHDTDASGFGLCLDLLRLGETGGAVSGVLGFLGNELLLAACEFGFIAEFIFGNGTLLVYSERTAFEHRFICLLLERLEGRRLQRTFQFAARREIVQSHRDDRETDVGKSGIVCERSFQSLAQRFHASIEQSTHRRLGQILERRLIHEAGKPRLDPFDWFANILPVGETDREIDAFGDPVGLCYPPTKSALDTHLLEVSAASLHEKRHLAVVHRHLCDARRIGAEPEDEAPSALPNTPIAIADNVVAGIAAQPRDESEIRDLCHVSLPQFCGLKR